MWVLPAAARAECISMSGLSPADTLRNTLRIRVSPKISDVLLCSAPTTIDGPPGGSSVAEGSRWKAKPSPVRSVAMPSIHRPVLSLSCSASYTNRFRPSPSASSPTKACARCSAASG